MLSKSSCPHLAVALLVAEILDEKQDPLLLESRRHQWLDLKLEQLAVSRASLQAAHRRAARWGRTSMLLFCLAILTAVGLVVLFREPLVVHLGQALLGACVAGLMVLTAATCLLAGARHDGLGRVLSMLEPLAGSAHGCEEALHLVNTEAVAHAHRDDVLGRARTLCALDLELMRRVARLARERRTCQVLHGVEALPADQLSFART